MPTTFTKITTGPAVTDQGQFITGVWGDFNNDGFLDLIVANYARVNVLYTNNGNGTFTKISLGNPVQDVDYHVSPAAADYDNDGFLDLIVTAGSGASTLRQNILYHNDGDGTFSRASGGGLTNQLGHFTAATWADYDNDGFLDLFITDNGFNSLLFHNNGDGTFSQITSRPPADDINGWGAVWADYDNDGFMDLLVTHAGVNVMNALFHNNRDGTFSRVTTNSVASDVWAGGAQIGTWGDYDNDGFQDLFVTGDTVALNRLYHNNGDGTFTSMTNGPWATGGSGAFGCAWGDYDNDGYLDLFVTHRNGKYTLFHNSGDGTFTQITSGDPVNDGGGNENSSCGWVDYDNDGFLDLFVSRDNFNLSSVANFLYHNNGNGNAWLKVKLVGTVSNRSAIGAKVRLRATIGGKTFWQMREISGGGGRWEQPLLAHFGLRDATNVDTLRIEWPSGTVQEFYDITPKQHLTYTEPARLDPPTIIQQPADLAVPLGATAVFQVTASPGPLAYQWWFNETVLLSATNRALTITNVQPADGGGYSVVVTNVSGAVTSRVATLQAGGVSPQLTPTGSFQDTAAELGMPFAFSVSASGDAPLAFQWYLDGQSLAGQTGSTLNLASVQSSDEGDYTLTVTNAFGSVAGGPAHLWTVPSTTNFIRANFTNAGLRLPYSYLLPANYDSGRKYPLFCWLHGSPNDETTYPSTYAGLKVFASAKRQSTDPAILVWPTRRAGDESWTSSYIQLVSALMGELLSDLSVDTNRIYLEADSEGVHAVWDLAAMRAGFFAGARFFDGYSGSAPSSSLAGLPIWDFHSAADTAASVGFSRTMVRSLRLAGGNPIYTEFSTGDHLTSIETGYQTSSAVGWLAAQRQGTASAYCPLLSITNQFGGVIPTTAATGASLAGSADAQGQSVSGVTWENTSAGASGSAVGFGVWNATNIPLLAGQTNLILVTGTTTSWSPVLGGNTTFNSSISLLSSPILASLSRHDDALVLTWVGGAPPFQLQMMTNLAGGSWQLIQTNVSAPLTFPPNQPAGFYRILGQ
jgi:hypothetical protein